MNAPSLPVPLIEAREITKQFGRLRAVRDASLTVYPNEVVALIGDNGAGKSTFANILAGAIAPDSGEISYLGADGQVRGIRDASKVGVSMVFQDLSLCPDLDSADNLYLGNEITKGGKLGRAFGILDRTTMREKARRTVTELGATIPSLTTTVNSLSGGQRQAVAIARSVHWASSVLLMDEPTAALGAKQRVLVTEMIRRVRDRGLGVILISHDLPNVMEVADRIAIMRSGSVTRVVRPSEVTIPALVQEMVG